MYTDKEREKLRDLLLEAFSDYQSKTGGAYDGSSIIQTEGYEKVASAMNCQGTRPRGKSKENCSPRVFEHIRLLRIVRDLPSHYLKWIQYRYAPVEAKYLSDDLVEICMGDLELFNGKKVKQRHREAMVEKWLVSNREFTELMQRDVFEAMGVSKVTFHRSYRAESDEAKAYWINLDKQALDRVLLVFTPPD